MKSISPAEWIWIAVCAFALAGTAAFADDLDTTEVYTADAVDTLRADFESQADALVANDGDLLQLIEALTARVAVLEATDGQGGTDAPPYSTDVRNPTPIARGEPIDIDIGQPLTVRVYSNATTLTTIAYTGEGPAVFTLEAEGIHTLIVEPDGGDTARYFVDHAASGFGPDLPPVGGEYDIVNVRPGTNGDDMDRNLPDDMIVENTHYKGDGSHGMEKGGGLRIITKRGGTVTLRDLLATDLSFGIIVQGTQAEPIDRLTIRNTRTFNTWKDGIDKTNFAADRPQPLFTNNIKVMDFEGLELFNGFRPGADLVFDRQHLHYAGVENGNYPSPQISIRNSVFIGGMFGGLNYSQIHNADRVYVIGCGANWNIDGKTGGERVDRVTGIITNSYSINPHQIEVFPSGRPWGNHFTDDRSPLPGVTALDGIELDLEAIYAAPVGEAYLEVERQLRELGVIQ